MNFFVYSLILIGIGVLGFNGYRFYTQQATQYNLIGLAVGVCIVTSGIFGINSAYANNKQEASQAVDLSQPNNFELLYLSQLKEKAYVLETETIYHVNYIEDKAIKRIDIPKAEAKIYPSVDEQAYLKRIPQLKRGKVEGYTYEIVLPEDHYETFVSKIK